MAASWGLQAPIEEMQRLMGMMDGWALVQQRITNDWIEEVLTLAQSLAPIQTGNLRRRVRKIPVTIQGGTRMGGGWVFEAQYASFVDQDRAFIAKALRKLRPKLREKMRAAWESHWNG